MCDLFNSLSNDSQINMHQVLIPYMALPQPLRMQNQIRGTTQATVELIHYWQLELL